ncbi:hypothetical protein F5X99DRAFT_411606 [Biscogniauxia marginata]|nr:hypothetical protein F5X99DRAFT_411606 [Biscogniauxia marginata]
MSSPMSSPSTPEVTFHCFPRLPSELRIMIWKYGLYSQNRIVGLRVESRHISYAPCPILFLVCQESKSVTVRAYQRLRRADITCEYAYPVSSRIGGPLVSFETDIFHIRLPVMVEKFWGSRIWNDKIVRANDPIFQVPYSEAEKSVDRFAATPKIKRILVMHSYPFIESHKVVLLALSFSGDHRDNAGERLRSELYKWLRAVDEAYVQEMDGLVLDLAGDAIKEQRRIKPNFDGVFQDRLSRIIEHMP